MSAWSCEFGHALGPFTNIRIPRRHSVARLYMRFCRAAQQLEQGGH
jgi:hypothetical protein